MTKLEGPINRAHLHGCPASPGVGNLNEHARLQPAHDRRMRLARLTAPTIYVINRLHIMSRIEAKTDVFRAIADPTRRATC